MKIVSYNVNGIRAAVKNGFLQWLEQSEADVVCLQEIKAMADQMPQFELQSLGYQCYAFPAKKPGYSGVAILSKVTPDQVVYGMNVDKYDAEGRVIRADYGDLSIISVYHPSGSSGEERQAFKMQWLNDFELYVQNLRQSRNQLVISGDYNICHQPIDIHDPIRNATSSGFLPEEREWISHFLSLGFVDTFRHMNPNPHHYSWWSYRANARTNNKGWRIDYNMITENLKSQITAASIEPQAKHSDHCPVILEIG